jgi:predicted aconitase with swiveling domain
MGIPYYFPLVVLGETDMTSCIASGSSLHGRISLWSRGGGTGSGSSVVLGRFSVFEEMAVVVVVSVRSIMICTVWGRK